MDLDTIADDMTEYMRLMAVTGLCHLRGGNCAVRVDDDTLVVTRTKTAKEKLTADHLLSADIHSDAPVPGASVNLSLHRLIFRKTDAKAVLHGHPYHAALLSYFCDRIAPIDENGLSYLTGEIEIIQPPGFKQWAPIDQPLSDALTRVPAVMMKWHGSYTIGASLAEAFHRTQALDSTARFILDVARLEPALGQAVLPDYVNPSFPALAHTAPAPNRDSVPNSP